jgi:hypothetical protein
MSCEEQSMTMGQVTALSTRRLHSLRLTRMTIFDAQVADLAPKPPRSTFRPQINAADSQEAMPHAVLFRMAQDTETYERDKATVFIGACKVHGAAPDARSGGA